jgi:hypothetical protein
MALHTSDTENGNATITGLAVLQNIRYEINQENWNWGVKTSRMMWFDAAFWISPEESQVLMVALKYWDDKSIRFNQEGHVGSFIIHANVSWNQRFSNEESTKNLPFQIAKMTPEANIVESNMTGRDSYHAVGDIVWVRNLTFCNAMQTSL